MHLLHFDPMNYLFSGHWHFTIAIVCAMPIAILPLPPFDGWSTRRVSSLGRLVCLICKWTAFNICTCIYKFLKRGLVTLFKRSYCDCTFSLGSHSKQTGLLLQLVHFHLTLQEGHVRGISSCGAHNAAIWVYTTQKCTPMVMLYCAVFICLPVGVK